ncbi:MAG: hypothetical protein ACI4OT_05600 [Bacilli bacterium]
MKNRSFIIFGFISVILLIALFSIAIDYKIENNKADETFNSGIIYIKNLKIKLPIKLDDLEEKIGTISFQSEYYDEENHYYYNEKSSSILPSSYTTEGIISIKDYKIGVFITNLNNKKEKINDCYITGVRLEKTSNIKLFKDINFNTKLSDLKIILKTGKLEPFKEEYNNMLKYKKDYILDINYNNEEITDIIYYFDYEKCKEENCDF